MNLGDLRTELRERGFNYLSDTRANRFLNQAISELAGLADWPFLYSDSSGSAPLSIEDLGRILSVTDSTNDVSLQAIDRRILADAYPDLPDSGSPTWYYLDSATSLAVYPADTTVTVKVRYIRVPAELTNEDETPVVPDRYHELVVDLAAVRAYKDRDNFDAANALRADADRSISRMFMELLNRDGEPQFIEVTGASSDW